MQLDKISIFICYHKKFKLIQGKSFIPIHVGRDIQEAETKDGISSKCDVKWLHNLIGDNTGDSISYLNREFCELTALYWIWKNVNLKKSYIGLMQYRRNFILNDYYENNNDPEKRTYGVIHFKNLKNYENKIGLTDESVKEISKNGSIIIPYEGDFESLNINSLWDDYVERIPGVHIDDLITLCDVVKEQRPEYKTLFDQYLDQNKKLMYQMMLMPGEELDRYCQFLFPIIFEVHRRINVSMYSVNGKRTIGYLAELLYGLYFTRIIDQNKVLRKGIAFID